MPNIWTINAVTGGSTKSDLVGCHIKENAAGIAYEFTNNNPNDVLSTTPTASLPTPPFQFPDFDLDGYTWQITVNTLTGGPSENRAEGYWHNNAAPDPVAAEDGTYTAQAGSGAAVEDDREAAASA
jgi:hypothetical protein